MAISSVATRYPEADQVLLSPASMIDTSRLHVSPSLFRTALAPRIAAHLGVDSELLETSGKEYWPSPALESFNRSAWPLLGSLLRTPEEDWPNLWVASLLRAHMVVRCAESDESYYVSSQTKWSICV